MATAGVVLLIITFLLFVVVLFHWNRKKSRKAQNIDDKQQHTHNIAGLHLSHCYHHVLSRKPKAEPTSRLEAINGAYISTKVKSLGSLLRQHSHSRSVSKGAGNNVNITPNPSYVFTPNSPQNNKELEQLQYDYASCDLLTASDTSSRVYDKVIEPPSDNFDHVHHANCKDALSQKFKVKPLSRLETINEAYISTKVKSLDSLLKQHNHSRSVSNTCTAGCNVTITPNPSYDVMSNTSQTKKEPEQLEYDYTSYDLTAASAASGGVCGDVSNSASNDNVTINLNPSYSLPYNGQDVKLEDNPSYAKLTADVASNLL